MANITANATPKRSGFSIHYHQLINVAFAIFAAILVYLVVNAIIGGKCDGQCVIDMLNQTIRYAAPIALAAYCGLMCERAAVINIGIEGMMLMGAMVAYGVNVYAFTGMKSSGVDAATAGEISRWIALGLAVASSGLLALLHGFVSIRFKTDQIISGTVIERGDSCRCSRTCSPIRSRPWKVR